MSKTLRTIGTIAGAVALAATGVGAIASVSILGASLGTIGSVAGLVAGFSQAGAQLLAKPPPARGSVTQLIIAPDVPQPYMMGEGYYGGVLRHDAAYGATLKDVPNPYRGMVVVYSGGGPVQSITPYVDKAAVTAWYSTFLYTDTQLGATPEAAALSPNFAGLPGWDASSKLSGQAAILWNLLFDKKGKRFASGVPIIGAYGQWVKAYDPRLDSTFPGGSGSHVLGDESTYTWTENPALHFGTYAYGRYQNGKRTFGCGLTSIDWGVIAAWANVCDANSWTIFGVIYEPGIRWDNLKDIAAAGGAVPVVSSGGKLSVKYWAPQVALDTITAADIAEGQVQYSPLQSWDDRVNTIVPRYTSAAHEWNQVASDPVAISAFVTEDGEEKRKEWPYNLVKSSAQARQLAAYQIYEGRETSPIVIPCLPRLRAYRPGECLTLDLPDYGLEMDAIILSRTIDPATLTVTLTLIGETPAKHAAALGQIAAPPAAPVAGQDGEDRDETSDGVNINAPQLVADEAAMLLLDVPNGTLVKLADTGKVYYYNGGTSGTITDWTLISANADDPELNAIAGLTSAADQLPYFTGSGTAALATFTAVARTLLAQATQANMRTTGLGLGTIATQAANAVAITGGAVEGLTTFSTSGTGLAGFGVSSPAAKIHLGGAMSLSSWTTSGPLFRANSSTLTDTSSAGGATVATRVGSNFNAPEFASTNAITVTNAVSWYIAGAPTAGANTTITNAWGFWINSGNMNLQAGDYYRGGVKVLGARKTGWGTATGTATRTTFDTATVTLPQLAERVKALVDDLHGTAGHGIIGT